MRAQLDGEDDEQLVTFLDLVQALAVREVRQRHNIPLQRIRQGVDEARRKYDLAYPLACRHRIFLFSDKKGQGHGHIVIRLEGDSDNPEERYVQLTGRQQGNYLMRPVVEMFLDDITFDPKTLLAAQYRPLTADGNSVLLDPHRRFGEPIIESCGYSVESLWHATNVEGGYEEAASAYDVDVGDVILANKYYDILLNRTAA